MTDMAVTSQTSGPEFDEGHEIHSSATTSTEPPALITEQQVLFNTAAAVALPPARTRRWIDAVHAVADAVRVMFGASEKPAEQRTAKPVYPRRHGWLEDALMTREIDRL
jgi:hypothetical protein